MDTFILLDHIFCILDIRNNTHVIDLFYPLLTHKLLSYLEHLIVIK